MLSRCGQSSELLPVLNERGFCLAQQVLNEAELALYREEMDRVAEEYGVSCVRHLRAKSRIVDDLACSEKIRQLIGGNWLPVRSILFDKNEAMNWPVAWHQDLTIAVKQKHEVAGYGPWSEKEGAVHVHAPVEVLRNMVTLRFHLDDTPSANGALRVVPGSHVEKIESSLIAGHVQGREFICECKAGDALLMSPLVLHASHKVELPSRRRVIHIEYARPGVLSDLLEWHESAG